MFSKIRARAERRGSWSLAVLLTAWYAGASFLLVAFATLLLYFGLAANLRRLSEQMLTDELVVCRALVSDRSGDSDALREEVEIDSAVRRYRKFYIRVLNDRNQALFTTPGMDRDLPASYMTQRNGEGAGQIFRVHTQNGTDYRGMIAPVSLHTVGRQVWTLQIAVELTQELEVLAQQRIWVWAVLGAAALFCPSFGYLIALRGTRPLRDIAETARHVSSSTLNERIRPEGYPAEIATLAVSFNAMLERLEDSFARLSRFSADIAHELRTPVNNIRGQSEVALGRLRTLEEYREVLGSCLEESVRLSDLIESLLFLARVESPGEHLKRAPVDLGELLMDLRDYYEAAAAEVGVTLAVNGNVAIRAQVDRVLLQRALGNLVSNALSHSANGQSITLDAQRDGGRIRVVVSDQGSGIPPQALSRVFDRFYRADPARPRRSGGTGLGLAIVKQIVSLHGGEVKIASEAGRGTVVSIFLPAED